MADIIPSCINRLGIYQESEIEIYFNDLKPDARKEFLEKLGTTPEDENWNVCPIAIFVREEDEI
jgi:hypothetical protein